MSKTKPKIHRLTPAEYLVWQQTLETCKPDGTVSQTAAEIADAILAKNIQMIPRSVQKLLRRLVESGHLIEIRESGRDAKGWIVPAQYKTVKEFKEHGVVLLGGGLKKAMRITQ
jgi:hypothetical protein